MNDFTVTEALEAYPIFKRILEHLNEYRYLTRKDYDDIVTDEYRKKIRQDLLKIEGGSDVVLIDVADLP